jgi:ribonuclease HII
LYDRNAQLKSGESLKKMLLPYLHKNQVEAGCDEAGRGCLAGPVVAAAVILPKDFQNEELNDSKKINAKNRDKLAIIIKEHALAYAVGICTPLEIDEINILKASFLAMHKALDQLKIPFDHILVDGNRFTTYGEMPHTCVIKGDGKYMSIAAASILAKTYRDEYMLRKSIEYPQYYWHTNMGYPTKAHRKAIAAYGITPLHRLSFQLLPDQLGLFD